MRHEEGDVVQLRSGGPNMLVMRAEGAMVDCAWVRDGALAVGTFPVGTLRRIAAAAKVAA